MQTHLKLPSVFRRSGYSYRRYLELVSSVSAATSATCTGALLISTLQRESCNHSEGRAAVHMEEEWQRGNVRSWTEWLSTLKVSDSSRKRRFSVGTKPARKMLMPSRTLQHSNLTKSGSQQGKIRAAADVTRPDLLLPNETPICRENFATFNIPENVACGSSLLPGSDTVEAIQRSMTATALAGTGLAVHAAGAVGPGVQHFLCSLMPNHQLG